MSDVREEIKKLICESRNADIATDAIIAAGYSKRTPGEEVGLIADIDREMDGRARGHADTRGELLFRCRDALSTRPAGESAGVAEALEPFAKLGAILDGKEKDDVVFVGQVRDGVHHPITFGDLRRAARASQPSAGEVE